jgi:hypothetical protein
VKLGANYLKYILILITSKFRTAWSSPSRLFFYFAINEYTKFLNHKIENLVVRLHLQLSLLHTLVGDFVPEQEGPVPRKDPVEEHSRVFSQL